MKDVVRTSADLMWREVETSEEAIAIGNATQTAFGVYFNAEAQQKVRANRYFVLGDDYVVIGCVPADPTAPSPGRGCIGAPLTLFVGSMNQNPFPAYQPEISELAAALGVGITPEHSYRSSRKMSRGPDDTGSPSP